jgi:hypothetical protein
MKRADSLSSRSNIAVRTCPNHGPLSIASDAVARPCSICGTPTTRVEYVPRADHDRYRAALESLAADDLPEEIVAQVQEALHV